MVPDIDADLAAGVRGLPQRLGAARASVTGAVLLTAAVLVVTVGPGEPPWWAWAGLRRRRLLRGRGRPCWAPAATPGRAPFLLAVATAVLAVALLVARAPDLG